MPHHSVMVASQTSGNEAERVKYYESRAQATLEELMAVVSG